MALKYGGKVYRSLEEQVRANMEDISDLSEQLDNVTTVSVEQVEITGTRGTLTEEQLTTLQTSEQNQIVCDNEIFRLMDNQVESGYLVYGHVGAISSKQTVKTITITLSTKGWVLQSSAVGGSIKLYEHQLRFFDYGEHIFIYVINDRKEPYEYINEDIGKEIFNDNSICYGQVGTANGVAILSKFVPYFYPDSPEAVFYALVYSNLGPFHSDNGWKVITFKYNGTILTDFKQDTVKELWS